MTMLKKDIAEMSEDEYAEAYAEWSHRQEETRLLFHDVRAFLTDYIVFHHELDSIAVTLWIVHTWLLDHFSTTPRLVVRGPDKQCGKSRVLECLELLCKNAVVRITPTMSTFFHEIGHVTMLQDEYQAVFDTNGIPELVSAYNAGWRRKGGSVPRMMKVKDEGWTLVTFPVFGAVAFAGAPAEDRHNDIPPMILDRSVIIEMERKLPDEVVQDFDSVLVEDRATWLHDRLQAWSATVDEMKLPMVPDGLRDRQRDIWRPLLQMAELATNDGDAPWNGAWPEAARLTCEWKCEVQTDDDDESSLGKRLLRDIRAVFDDIDPHGGEVFIKSSDLLFELQSTEDWEWLHKEYGQPVLDINKLAKYLRNYGIKPVTARRADDPKGERPRGYYRSMFSQQWARYLSGEDGGDVGDDLLQ